MEQPRKRLSFKVVIGLCLTASVGLASQYRSGGQRGKAYYPKDDGKKISTTQKLMLENADYFIRAFTEPSMEYLGAYLKVFFALAALAYTFWYCCGPKEAATMKVSFDDIGGKFELQDSPAEEVVVAKEKKSPAKRKRVESTRTKDTTVTTAKKNPVLEYRSMSLKREYLKKGPFDYTESGEMLKTEAYAKAMAIMAKHVWIKFNINRKEILENRYSLYQDRAMKEHDKMISTQLAKYTREIAQIEDNALMYLELEKVVFKRSKEFFFKNARAQELWHEIYQRELCETWTDQLPDQELAQQVCIEGYAINLMNMVKIPPVLVKSLNTAIGHYMNDVYMVVDAAQEDHDLKEVQIKKAIVEYHIEESPLVKGLKEFKAALLTKYNIEAASSNSKKENLLTREQSDKITAVIEKNFQGIEFNQKDDVLTFFNFVNLTGLTVQFASKFFIETSYKKKSERRVFLLKGEMASYDSNVKSYQQRHQELGRLVLNEILGQLKMPHELWNRSLAFYGHNALYAPQLYSIVNNFPFKHMVIPNEFYNETKKKEEFDALISVAQRKEDIYVSLLQSFMEGRLSAEDVPLIFEQKTVKLYDDYWRETNLEEEEIFNDFYDHKMPFKDKYIQIRDQSWRRLAQKLQELEK